MFFQIPVNKKNKKESYQEELEERIISLIASLFGKQASLFRYQLYYCSGCTNVYFLNTISLHLVFFCI